MKQIIIILLFALRIQAMDQKTEALPADIEQKRSVLKYYHDNFTELLADADVASLQNNFSVHWMIQSWEFLDLKEYENINGPSYIADIHHLKARIKYRIDNNK